MQHKEIMKKWIGGRYQESIKLGYQCVSWAKKYCQERGYPIKSFGGYAITGYITGSPFDSNWVCIKKTPWNYPSEGDLVFWNANMGKGAGHVAVANKFCNPLVLRTTDQNAGSGNGDGLGKNSISPFFRTYKNVVGWYHRK